MDYDPSQTQPSTQQVLDPRRLGRNNSGLSTADISDVICILHPASPAAFLVVANTAKRTPRHVLQNDTIASFDDEGRTVDLEEQETFIIDSEIVDNAQDLALRFSSETVQPVLGFTFGRNARSCDVVIDTDSYKRVSNLHFRIYMNSTGVLMLEDMSTNGTLVDEVHLKGKNTHTAATRMLQAGSIIQIPSVKKEESIKFIVRMPSRSGFEMEYADNVRKYMKRMQILEQQHNKGNRNVGQYKDITQLAPHVPSNPFGMKWDGGEEYNVVGHLGKGAFAIVYKLATKMDGKHYAAKELDKRRFTKNGRLDHRLDNEMQIMKTIRHDNIVQYMGYHDHADQLYIIMEYVPCGDLQGYLTKNKVIREPQAKAMSRQCLDALHYLHEKRITHRDIKPDNILIAQYDPFIIKLSDFGLSKIVSTDQTFLKTFCGTLLYCAPEVFPHYEDHLASKGVKRRRSGNAFAPKFHSYSHSVDIWSYAAVLWLAMCQKPPFEGVVDQTGKGMFDNIMDTKLDISPLLAWGVSTQAIDLMCRMLNKDPARRPTELECFQHPWLYDGKARSSSQTSGALLPISEDVEGVPLVDSQAQQLSQLSLKEGRAVAAGAQRQLSNVKEEDEGYDFLQDYDSDDLDFGLLDPRKSKRVRADKLVPRHHARDNQAAISSSSPELSQNGEPEDEIDAEDFGLPIPATPPTNNRGNRFFGEIGNSALESSGLLGEKTAEALDLPSSQLPSSSQPEVEIATGSKMSIDASAVSFQNGQMTSEMRRSDQGSIRYPSLMGTESELRELNMVDIPGHDVDVSGDSQDPIDEPRTPKTPDNVSEPNSCETKSPLSQQKSSVNATPRQEDDSVTHPPQIAVPSSIPIPASEPNRMSSQPPVIGILRTTPDSFIDVELRLQARMSHFGRLPANTFVHPDPYERRIPKRAFTIWFHAYGIERSDYQGQDWRIIPDLHTVISTQTACGIHVNGVKLMTYNEHKEHMCGRLYTGDVIEVFTTNNRDTGSQQTLRFTCEFYYGEAERTRPPEIPFRPEPGIEPSAPRQSF